MLRKIVRAALYLGVVLCMAGLAREAWAEGDGSSTGPQGSEAEEVRSELRRQEEVLDRAVGRLTNVGEKLEESRWRVEDAKARQKDLGKRARELSAQLETQKDASARSRARLEGRVRAAYRGEDLDGLMLVMAGLFGGGDARGDASATLHATRLLTESSRSIQDYTDAKQSLRSTLRQVEQSKAEYREYGEESQASVAELAGREAAMRDSIERLGLERDRLEGRLAELEAEERAGLLRRPPATGRGDESETRDRDRAPRDERNSDEQEEEERARDRELEIAREDITADPVDPIPYEDYVRLYKESAERYGFGGDWYVLAAVGKIESNHGENIGPSSAGAMGPMQFLPSTWASYGVDGDGDGEANIMDPEDAIPAAASYLRAGGAPDDWYAALFTYNRAGWYVEEVLAIAESYRRIHGDDTVGPYLEPRSIPSSEEPRVSAPPPERNDGPELEEPGPRDEEPAPQRPEPVTRPEDQPAETTEGPAEESSPERREPPIEEPQRPSESRPGMSGEQTTRSEAPPGGGGTTLEEGQD